jgi:uncharacterized repeat protein (TIGR03837 family)
MPETVTPQRWDVVCRVVDHYGDAGVCLRLARALAQVPDRIVRLLVDQPAVLLALIQPPPSEGRDRSGVQIVPWDAVAEPADVVVETFGGGLPPAYRESMQRQRATGVQPAWINLDHLSAEDWVEGCHRLPSLQADGLVCQFFYPGFTARTGGLLRPLDRLPALPDAVLDALKAPQNAAALTASVFCYRDSRLAELLDAMAQGPRPIRALVPAELPADLGGRALDPEPGAVWQDGALTLLRVPFLDQDAYDALLARCDFNLVRGEDSWVRAQWAGKPLIWQAYRQEAATRSAKVEAWLDRGPMPPAWTELNRAFNCEPGASDSLANCWNRALTDWTAAQQAASDWRTRLAAGPDLAVTLAEFAASTVQSRV